MQKQKTVWDTMLILGNPVSVFLQLVIKTTWRVPFNGMSDGCYWVERSLQSDCFFLGIKGYFICQRKTSAFTSEI